LSTAAYAFISKFRIRILEDLGSYNQDLIVQI